MRQYIFAYLLGIRGYQISSDIATFIMLETLCAYMYVARYPFASSIPSRICKSPHRSGETRAWRDVILIGFPDAFDFRVFSGICSTVPRGG